MTSSDQQRYGDDELLALSGLQHLAYCERQWGLIHLEGQWVESALTAEGRILHERTEVTETEVRGNKRIARGLRLRSLRLGIVGRADVVEFHRLENDDARQGIHLHNADGLWKPVPVEYKRGKPKPDHRDQVQLCAQGICLEEMLETNVDRGFLFYGKPRERQEIELSNSLKQETEQLAGRLHELFDAGQTPPPTNDPSRCRSCSLRSVCLPKATRNHNASDYLSNVIDMPSEENQSETSS
ncbi:MAG: CRISPR-associated protein Cas4 [Candidatus Brocadiia bacterium]